MDLPPRDPSPIEPPATNKHDSAGDIAIVGMSLRFPGADTVAEFWRNLCQGVESITFFSDAELAASGVSKATLENPNFVKASPRLRDVEHFDAAFFGFNPREAEFLDPQVRLFLECCWEALESAGCDPDRSPGPISVYAGDNLNHYFMQHVIPSLNELGAGANLFSVAMHNEKDALATLVSHKLNLRGPSMTVQTYCSTSLVAAHLGIQSLRSGESYMALAGGVSLTGPQLAGYFHEEGGIFSNDGHNRAFDARGKGTVFGNGAGVVALKRLSDAQADGDVVYAVIRGTAVNNDGATKAGYSAPSAVGQAEAILLGLEAAGVSPDSIGYFETHGTATPIGDPIEVQAMTQAYRKFTARKQFCPIGSLKTNVGHLDRAAGVAGLIKAALILKHRQVPPSLHFQSANPKIDFENSPFYVNTALSPLRSNGAPLRVAVSSLGVGGTNAHAILEEAPAPPAVTASRPIQVLPLSARTEAALENATQNLVKFLNQNPEMSLPDGAFTLQTGRRAFAQRRVILCRDAGDAVRAVEARNTRQVLNGSALGAEGGVVFLFPGQGAQYVNMARGLYEREECFRSEVDRACLLLESDLGFDLRTALFPPAGGEEAAAERLRQTATTQPALFVIEYALAQVWMSWGVTPRAMIGHSIGEYVAACLAGVFSLSDALSLVAARGRLLQGLPAGEMLAVPLAEADLVAMMPAGLSLAAVNAPNSCVVSGPAPAIADFSAVLAARGVEGRKLQTSHAFHSAMMDSILEPFTARVRSVKRAAPKLPFVSNVTGTWITDAEATDPSYWATHLRQAVRFADGVATLFLDGKKLLLEVGPGRTLSGLARHHPAAAGAPAPLTSVRHVQEAADDQEFLLATLGRLWVAGVDVDWKAFSASEKRRRVALPSYPFERRRYWIDTQATAPTAAAPAEKGKKADLSDWFYAPSWKRTAMPPAGVARGASVSAPWLVLADDSALGAALVRRLVALGERVVTVRQGAGFATTADGYTASPGNRADYGSLMAALQATGPLPHRILHLWSLASANGIDAGNDYRMVQDRGFYSLLFLAQALGESSSVQPVRIAVLTDRLHAVMSEGALRPERATLLGPCKVIPQEYPDVSCVSVDLVLSGPGDADADLVERILAETDGSMRNPVVAYRGSQRWVQTFESVRLEPSAVPRARLREGGVYLITGGLGGIGLTMAAFLAAEYRAKLVLVQRTPLPAEAEWDGLVSRGGNDALTRKIAHIRELQSKGAEVLVCAADAGDFESMSAAVAQARARFGAVHGVMHGAGIAGDGIIQLKTAAVAAGVLDPKVKGALVLERIFRGEALDFMLFFSSIAAVTGGFGQVDYCAANNFLDVLASGSAPNLGRLTASIDWDAWAEVGMAVDSAAKAKKPAGGRAVAEGAPWKHPYFPSRTIDGPQEHYRGLFSPEQHWFLREHRLFGVPTFPSTAYLELARSVFARKVPGAVTELRDVYFFSPFAVPHGESRELELLLVNEGAESAFTLRSRKPGGAEWQEHCSGRLGVAAKAAPKVHDVAALDASCRDREILNDVSQYENDLDQVVRVGRHLELGSRWNHVRRVAFGPDREFIVQEMPEARAADVEGVGLHPALMDFTALLPTSGDAVYIPFSYGVVRSYAPLPARIRTFVVNRDDPRSGKETIVFDAFIMDPEGRGLVDIEGLTMRRIDPSGKKAEAGKFAEGSGYRLSMEAPGSLADLKLIPWERPAAGPGIVEIEVCAAGLNFKDVLRALGMLKGLPDGDVALGFGTECAGRISAVGEGVTGLKVGDEVMAIAVATFAGYALTRAELAVPIPANLSFEQAAGIPLVFLTAYQALVEQARLRSKERVLIHAAAGGVGLAALQIAKQIGAEIYATAGSAAKRDFVKALGARHVATSRSLDFADDIRRETGGEGVDVVLNSLSGEFIAKSLSLLRPYGRFAEIGARDIYANSLLGLRPFANNLSFAAVDLGPMFVNRADDIRAMFLTVAGHLSTGAYSPLPIQVFPLSRVEEAFEFMAAAKQIGKIVIQVRKAERRAAADTNGPGRSSAGSADLDQALLPSEAVEAFTRILSAGLPQVVVTGRELQPLIEWQKQAAKTLAAVATAGTAAPRTLHPRPVLATACEPARTDTEKTLVEIWRQLLGIEEVGINDNFFELGGDSLVGVQVLSRIKKECAVQLPSAALYEGPTVAQFALAVEAARAAAGLAK